MNKVKVVEVDLDLSFPIFDDVDVREYGFLQILVRKNAYPVGYAWVRLRHPRHLCEEYVRCEIDRQLYDDVRRVEVAAALTTAAPAAPLPTITVALCTRNRPESLRRALGSIAAFDYPPHLLNVLVVDNAPTDLSTHAVVAEFPTFRYVREMRPGLDWARNRAIAEATGAIIAFTDDDVAVDRLWLRAIVPPFADQAVMCVTGLVAPAERETAPQNLFEEYKGFGKGFVARYYSRELQKVAWHFPLGAGILGTGANMAFRRSVFADIGLFDEGFDVGTATDGGGDLDMFYRVVSAGHAFVYEPGALVWHYHRRDMAALDRQIRSWGRATYAHWTKIFVTQPTERRRVARMMLWWGLRGYIKPAITRRGMARRLTLIEARGALQGAHSYFVAQRRAREIARQKYDSPQPTLLDTMIDR